MPTGFTEKIINGEVRTPKDFLHLCLRGFGILACISDQNLDVNKDYTDVIMKYTQSSIDYHKKFLEVAKEKLKQYQEMSDDDLYQKYVQENSKRKKDCEDVICENEGINAKYADFAERIRNWECSPEYESIKNFALEQLKISKENVDYWEDELAKIGDLSREDFEKENTVWDEKLGKYISRKEEYKYRLIDAVNWDVDYHQKEMENAISEQTRRINYYHFFKQELEKLK